MTPNRWQRFRAAWRETMSPVAAEIRRDVGSLKQEMAEVRARRPVAWPIEYVRCPSCRRTGYRTTERSIVSHRDGETTATPTEYQCPLCKRYSVRVVGDEPTPDRVTLTCTARLGIAHFFDRCDSAYEVPADASAVVCPVCDNRRRR